MRVLRTPSSSARGVSQVYCWLHMPAHGAKHSPPAGKFQNSEGPRSSVPEQSDIQILEVKLHPHKILDADSSNVRIIFQLYPPHVLNPSSDGLQIQHV